LVDPELYYRVSTVVDAEGSLINVYVIPGKRILRNMQLRGHTLFDEFNLPIMIGLVLTHMKPFTIVIGGLSAEKRF
jgi:hypothetical protein